MAQLEPRPALDVSGTPAVVFGPRSILWMANLGYMAIEGSMFLMLIVSYFYYRTRVNDWPPEQNAPGLLWGTINLGVLLLSIAPNYLLKKLAQRQQIARVGAGLLVLILFGVAALAVRVVEFPALNCRWDENAYASTVWALLGLHSAHLLTEWVELLVIAGVFAAGRIEGSRFVDVEESANYWYFVVLFEIAIYLVVYVAPRVM
jgi:cytochrome c oxidase subunit 3